MVSSYSSYEVGVARVGRSWRVGAAACLCACCCYRT